MQLKFTLRGMLLALTISLGLPASADTVGPFTQSFNNLVTGAGDLQRVDSTFSFPAFDTSLGTLERVHLAFDFFVLLLAAQSVRASLPYLVKPSIIGCSSSSTMSRITCSLRNPPCGWLRRFPPEDKTGPSCSARNFNLPASRSVWGRAIGDSKNGRMDQGTSPAGWVSSLAIRPWTHSAFDSTAAPTAGHTTDSSPSLTSTCQSPNPAPLHSPR